MCFRVLDFTKADFIYLCGHERAQTSSFNVCIRHAEYADQLEQGGTKRGTRATL